MAREVFGVGASETGRAVGFWLVERVMFSSRGLLWHLGRALALSVSTDWMGLEAANTWGARGELVQKLNLCSVGAVGRLVLNWAELALCPEIPR